MIKRYKHDIVSLWLGHAAVSNSHLTAISRKSLPVPVKWLLTNGLIKGNVLDYGCGKCRELNDTVLAKTPGINSVLSYDPYYHPDALTSSDRQKFDVVLCTYVLCTLSVELEAPLLKAIQRYLLPHGVAYITVRNDEPKGGYGVSSKGTFQRKVLMPYLFELRGTPHYSIYLLTADRKLI